MPVRGGTISRRHQRLVLATLHHPRRDPSHELRSITPSPELAAVLRSQSRQIIEVWIERVKNAIPSVRSLTFDELRDNTPNILARIADGLESADPERARALVEESPVQGVTRFEQHYDVQALLSEDRLLRRTIVEHVWRGLARPVTLDEQVSLDIAIDAMLHQAVTAFVTRQGERLRAASEAELKYLSFISHDLNNNLGGVTLLLKLLRQRLATAPDFAADAQTLDTAQRAIADTIAGMRRLLDKERLRSGTVEPVSRPVNLHRLVSVVIEQVAFNAVERNVKVVLDVPTETVIVTDGELVQLVLQNLVGNAVKYGVPGTVRVRASDEGGPVVISVSDDGPGIAPEQIDHIFDAFRRGEGHARPGVGLGLTIASQAAKLLGATLTVESKLGMGSTFALTLPAAEAGVGGK